MILSARFHRLLGLNEFDIWAPLYELCKALWTNGLSEMLLGVRGRGELFETPIKRCFPDYNQGLETWFK